MAKRNQRKWHEKFLQYMEYIVKHPNYKDMPNKFDDNGNIRWVRTGKSDPVLTKWWDDMVKKLKLNCRADVARYIHPKELKGMKPCQICGREMSIFYVYPNKNTLKKINELVNSSYEIYDLDIFQIFDDLYGKNPETAKNVFQRIFKIPSNIDISQYKQYIRINYVNKCAKGKLSPGVMCNPPDRLDGFHTYNACCRSEEDTGRHKENLARYTQDRRAYENWAEGDYTLANRLMGAFQSYTKEEICPICGKKARMSADHIGPISLGFTHRGKFNPMCSSCNSKKNNRITLSDVKQLIKDEANGEQVISWHTKPLWDKLKTAIDTEDKALALSKVMRLHLHNVLLILPDIYEKGYKEFLKTYLHPEYSYYDHKFPNFNPMDKSTYIPITKECSSANKTSNAQRYIRISFEELANYKEKDNRKVKNIINDKIEKFLKVLYKELSCKRYKEAKITMNSIIEELSNITQRAFITHKVDEFIEID